MLQHLAPPQSRRRVCRSRQKRGQQGFGNKFSQTKAAPRKILTSKSTAGPFTAPALQKNAAHGAMP